MNDAWWAPLAIQLALAGPLAIFFAWALRRSGAPGGHQGGPSGGRWGAGAAGAGAGAGALGGLIVAVFIGPSILGRVSPEFHHALFIGGVEESRAIDEAADEIRARLAALRATDVSQVAITEAMRDYERELDPLRAAHADALESRRSRSWWLIVTLAAVHTAIGMATLLPPTPRVWSRAARSLLNTRAAPVGAGVLALTIAAAPVAGALLLAPGLTGPALIAGALIFAVPGFAPGIGQPAPMITALTAFIVGGIIFFALTPTLEMFTIAACACFGAMMSLGWPALVSRCRKHLSAFLACVTLPVLIALAGAQVDPTQWSLSRSAWDYILPLLIALLWASDGRWLALYAASRLFALPRPGAWTGAARQVNAGAGSIELVLAIVWFASVLKPSGGVAGPGGGDDRVLAAAIVGVVVIELTRDLRLRVARMLDGTDDPE